MQGSDESLAVDSTVQCDIMGYPLIFIGGEEPTNLTFAQELTVSDQQPMIGMKRLGDRHEPAEPGPGHGTVADALSV